MKRTGLVLIKLSTARNDKATDVSAIKPYKKFAVKEKKIRNEAFAGKVNFSNF
jgi:hypothetical protein